MLIRLITIFLILLLNSCVTHPYPIKPDRSMSPGRLCTVDDRHFDHFRYHENIPYCRRAVSSSLRRDIYDSYGIPEETRHEYTIDHIIPLSIGGSNHPENLWPEHQKVKNTRPNLEFCVYIYMRNDELTQRDALDIIMRAKYNEYPLPDHPCVDQLP